MIHLFGLLEDLSNLSSQNIWTSLLFFGKHSRKLWLILSHWLLIDSHGAVSESLIKQLTE